MPKKINEKKTGKQGKTKVKTTAATSEKTSPDPDLSKQVVVRFALLLLIMGLLLFLPAGTLDYWNAWLLIAALFIPAGFTFNYLLKNNPELVKLRMRIKEKETPQKKYQFFSWIFFIFLFVIPALDFRFKWSHVSFLTVIISTIGMLCGYYMLVAVMKQNNYASRIVEVQENQKVIDTGLYSIVRHPMYLAGTIMYSLFPLILGSYYGLITLLGLPFLLVYRINDEEKLLERELKGYKAYMKKVKYKLIPFIW